MQDFMPKFWHFLDQLNAVVWHDYVLVAVLLVGVLFTVWSGFCQYRSLTHGVQCIRGVYSKKGDPGAINHFQALSTALSGTVGLGNIAGVALAVALGGPGAVFWMWIVAIVGMALKSTEVTLAMLYRNTDDPDNPHGGAMWVASKGFGKWKLGWLGKIVGVVFCLTVIISTVTGGNMFQAWSVADITSTYFPSVPKVATGIIMAVLVGLTIIGGIKRIGAVTGRLVPFMCILYLLAAMYVLIVKIDQVPGMLALIVKSALPPQLGGEAANPQGAFLGGTFGYAFLWGMKRALFSNEAGQGSSPMAHSAAKTDEPVREGVVAGLEPFIDTIVVCTLTALVMLASGAWNRDSAANYESPAPITLASQPLATLVEVPSISRTADGSYSISDASLPAGSSSGGWKANQSINLIASARDSEGQPRRIAFSGKVNLSGGNATARFSQVQTDLEVSELQPAVYDGALPIWKPTFTHAPAKRPEAERTSNVWRENDGVFVLVDGDFDANTGRSVHQITGKLIDSDDDDVLEVSWREFDSRVEPRVVDTGLYMNLAGPSLTGHAFDRVQPRLGMWIVTIAAWLFAISTIISWSYYGEQAMVYMLGSWSVLPYKLIYCALIVVATLEFIETDAQLDALTTIGTGIMLWANIPIMLIFGTQAMRAWKLYMRKLRAGEFPKHKAGSIVEVAEGRDE